MTIKNVLLIAMITAVFGNIPMLAEESDRKIKNKLAKIDRLEKQAADIKVQLDQKKALFEKEQLRFSNHITMLTALIEKCEENETFQSEECQKMIAEISRA